MSCFQKPQLYCVAPLSFVRVCVPTDKCHSEINSCRLKLSSWTFWHIPVHKVAFYSLHCPARLLVNTLTSLLVHTTSSCTALFLFVVNKKVKKEKRNFCAQQKGMTTGNIWRAKKSKSLSTKDLWWLCWVFNRKKKSFGFCSKQPLDCSWLFRLFH